MIINYIDKLSEFILYLLLILESRDKDIVNVDGINRHYIFIIYIYTETK